jgi:hypothetical protein
LWRIENKWGVFVMINARLLQLAAVGFCLAPSSGAFASTITSADITISNLTISGDQSFSWSFNNGTVTAQAGLDSFANQNAQTLTISNLGATSANAAIATSTANAANTIPLTSGSGTSISIPGTVSASSTVNLTGGSSSPSFGIANPIYKFLDFNATPTNPVHLTFSMTVAGSLNGSADALGTYSSEISAQFRYQTNLAPIQWIPVVSFDRIVGGPSDSQNFGPLTLTGTLILDQNADFFFDVLVEAQSSATELGTSATPLPAALPLFASGLGAFGLLGWRRKRKAQTAA